MSYSIGFRRSAERELARLQVPVRIRILAAIAGLRQEPRPPGCLKLKGSKNAYRMRVGDYRVLYTIEDQIRIVLIEQVGDRKDIYR